MGLCEGLKSEIPVCGQFMAILLLILNIFIPGSGTIIMSCLGACKVKTFFVGILQFFLTFLLIGWIWSIWWGIICLNRSK